MIRPAVGQEDLQNLAGRVGSGQEVFEVSWIGSGRVGSGGFQIVRVGSS